MRVSGGVPWGIPLHGYTRGYVYEICQTKYNKCVLLLNGNAVPAILQVNLMFTFNVLHSTDLLHIIIFNKFQLAPDAKTKECLRGLRREPGVDMWKE